MINDMLDNVLECGSHHNCYDNEAIFESKHTEQRSTRAKRSAVPYGTHNVAYEVAVNPGKILKNCLHREKMHDLGAKFVYGNSIS
jgi:hypothetical protein